MSKDSPKSLSVLLVEDSDDDAQLLIRHLRKAGYRPQFAQVQTAADMRAALREAHWNIILADNSMPGFSADAALAVLQETGLDIPFIIVSGQIDDESAVAAMAAGAQDYMLKDNLARLVPAIEREVHDARIRHARRTAEAELHYRNRYDRLTELHNRQEFESRLEQAAERARQAGATHVLCYLDLDQFKLINEACGHRAGDEMLKQVALKLQQVPREGDCFGRLGGDEFGLLLEDCDLNTAYSVIADLRATIADFRFVWEQRSFEIGISIGVVTIGGETRNGSAALGAADIACQTAKELGPNRTHLYQADDVELAQRRSEMAWATRINDALDQDRLTLYSQPIAALSDTASAGRYAEILLRLIDENGETLSAGVFLPAAERYRLMPTIDRWVIRRLFQYLHEHEDGNGIDLYFVNLSGATINDSGFLRFLRDSFREYCVRPERICFEITESVAIANLGNSLKLFNTLKKLGCRFALDDFGSGLSSFAYLKNFPVDFLKIDGGFVRNLSKDDIDCAMVEAINKIGHVMGLRTVAEWVEDEATLDKLRAIGVDYGQGFGIAHPAPLIVTAST